MDMDLDLDLDLLVVDLLHVCDPLGYTPSNVADRGAPVVRLPTAQRLSQPLILPFLLYCLFQAQRNGDYKSIWSRHRPDLVG